MNIRRRSLPAGWYPSGKAETNAKIEEYVSHITGYSERIKAGIVPHAGWEFSGKIALNVLSGIPENIDTIVVIGGHLHSHDGVLAAYEEAYETPLGNISADLKLLQYLKAKALVREDRFADNTVEIQLPFIKFLFPDAEALSLRASPSSSAIELGNELFEAGKTLRRKLAVIGSTDLTHYGPNYGFSPRGSGPEAVRWVKEVNDKRLINALLEMKLSEALTLAGEERSACSIGGAVTAAKYAELSGITEGKLLDYTTSYDIYPGRSFVGYAGIIYSDNAP